MPKYSCLLLLILVFQSCQSQDRTTATSELVGGPCEGCEAIHEYGDKVLHSIDTLPLFDQTEPKLKITGTVFQKDGKTPAKDVILYIYHTNREGIYQTKGEEEGWARRHGFIRGWVKTNASGKYTFYTFRPGAYPNRGAPEHIHPIVKEEDKNEYYLDDYLFDDDPILTTSERSKQQKRGGSGIVRPELQGEIYLVERDIILGLNIPNYE
ncbi:MAG: intradiol ring-cleavage dioxygenase [Cyclobacteriaceae bacterium]